MEKNEFGTPFFWRRLHSFAGLWLSIFIIFHLLTNSQAALWFNADGEGFIREVNWIHSLPFLPLLEVSLLGFPILVHTIWGIGYLRTAKSNSTKGDGTTPYMPYPRNRAYTWQRITGALLAILLLGHIVHMRFWNYPEVERVEGKKVHQVWVSEDPGLYSLEKRLDFTLVREKEGEVLASASDFGTASLLVVRDTFKSPLMMMLYTLLVLSAVFHGYNGLATFLITWGITLSERSQKGALLISKILMGAVGLMGLSAIFFTYWITLKE